MKQYPHIRTVPVKCQSSELQVEQDYRSGMKKTAIRLAFILVIVVFASACIQSYEAAQTQLVEQEVGE